MQTDKIFHELANFTLSKTSNNQSVYANKNGNLSIVIDNNKQCGKLMDTQDEVKIGTNYKSLEAREDKEQVPTTYNQAWNHPDPLKESKWKEAILDELIEIQRKGVWEVMDDSKQRTIRLKWVFKISKQSCFLLLFPSQSWYPALVVLS